MNDPTPALLPGSQSKTVTASHPPPPGTAGLSPPISAAETAIPPSNVPLMPPPPPGSLDSPSAPPPKPPKRKPRRFTRFLLTLIALSGLSYAGGVYYSLVSDNFHDFFTEYVPFGEDAVLYFEEREFRKRFPKFDATANRPSDATDRVTIPSNSGSKSKERVVTDQSRDLETKGRHMSAVGENQAVANSKRPQSQPTPPTGRGTTEPSAADEEKIPPSAPKESKTQEKSKGGATAKKLDGMATSKTVAESPQTSIKLPEVNEPSVFLPITRIDPISIKNADEPLVQDLVKMLNDIIAVVNADNAAGKYNSSITKAKNELSAVGQKIMNLKAAQQKAADNRVNATKVEFDQAAHELLRRLEQEMRDQDGQWRDEFESERQKMAKIYDERFKSEIKKSKQITDQQIRNQLMEQSIALKKEFASVVQDRVETERQGRLSKLADLSTSVDELEKLTKQWNSVLDANIRTQHLQVAIEAVRSSLEKADRPRPFVRELAALKELASGNPVVDSAIASINPSAYQLGIPTSAQLVDRFRRVADEVRKASLLPEDAGIASHAASLLLSKVMFKKHGRAVGDDVESVLTRTETLLEEGNLDDAAREMNTLQGWAKTLSRDWLGEVRKVLEVRQALDVGAISQQFGKL